ncbi:hypothetical protein PG989_008711 [Apiospora arundinis]
MPEIETVSGSELLIQGGGNSPCGSKPHEDIEVILLEPTGDTGTGTGGDDDVTDW